ncbi:MAG: DUF2271 domain-containing protein [bacterium]
MNHKKKVCGLIILLFIFGIQSDSFNSNNATGGTVTFQVQTVSYGGKYADKNIGAIWVENAQNQFVKTLEVWARKRMKHLVKWGAASSQNVVDAVTSATLRSHQQHSVTWNCTDSNGAVVADGNYQIIVEFAEHNAASSGAAPGKWLAVTFNKGSSPQNLKPADETYFKNIVLNYTPSNATPPAVVSGSVHDAASNNPLQNAAVQLKAGNQVLYETNSNVSGLYSFSDVQAGSYTLICSKTGYDNWTENLTINAGDQITNKNIRLSPSTDSTPPAAPVNVKVNIANQ